MKAAKPSRANSATISVEVASIEGDSRDSSPATTQGGTSTTSGGSGSNTAVASRSFRSPFVTPFRVSENGHKGVCTLCQRVFRGFSASVAGRHLRSAHTTEYEALKNGHTIALNLGRSSSGYDREPDDSLMQLPLYFLSDTKIEELRAWMANEKSHNIDLIEAVKRHDVLYNRQNPKYKDNFHRQSVWNIIASEVPAFADGKAANARWKQLRQAYTRNRRRMQDRGKAPLCLLTNGTTEDDNGAATDEMFVEKWTNMRWLEPFLDEGEENSQEKGTSNSDQDDSIVDYKRFKPENGMTTFLDGLIENSIELAQSQHHQIQQQRPESRKRKPVVVDRMTPPPTFDRHAENGGDFDDASFFNRQLLEVMATQMSRANGQVSTNGDGISGPFGEEEAYSRYIVEKMKKLTPQQRVQARMKIENLFYEIEYRESTTS